MDFQKQIQDMIEKRAQELAEAKIQLLIQNMTSGKKQRSEKASSPKRAASTTPRGALKNAVLAAMTNTPMSASEIANRVKKVAPGFNGVQISNALSQLAGSKVCSRAGKRHSYKYFVKSK